MESSVANMSHVTHEVSASEEFAKNPDLKQEDLTSLRTWLATQEHLPHITDEMLILFHHSCYFNMEKTKDCIETYYTLRTNAPEFFTNRDLTYPALAKASQASNFVVLPNVDPDGNQIMFHSLRDADPSKYKQEEGIKLMLMTIDAFLLRSGTSQGLVILIDMQGIRLTHFTRIKLSAVRKFLHYLQEGNPVRLKAMHLINVGSVMDTILAIVKPLVKTELKNLLYFHTGGLESLYKCIPKECLPNDYGGELASVEDLNAEHNLKLQNLSEYFAREEKIRVDEKKRQKRAKKKQKHVEQIITQQPNDQ